MSNFNNIDEEAEYWTNPQKMREHLRELDKKYAEMAKNPTKRPFEDVESYTGHKKLFYEGRQIDGTMLTVVGQRLGERGPEVVCDCKCGKRIAIAYKTLYYNQAFSCGCTSKPPKELKPRYDFSGRTFGRLTVLEYKGADGWACLCRDCQEIEMVTSKPGYTYRALLEKAGARDCKSAVSVLAKANKPMWYVQIGYQDSPGIRYKHDQYDVRADTAEEAKAVAISRRVRKEATTVYECRRL